MLARPEGYDDNSGCDNQRTSEKFMLNRAAIILKYKEPAIRWVNEADPSPESDPLSLEDANMERTVYLISEDDADGDKSVDRWLRTNYETLFESELEGWYTDPSLWPKERTWKQFREWFDVECHTMLIDTVGDAIYDDEL
jgi:hypothetical protein